MCDYIEVSYMCGHSEVREGCPMQPDGQRGILLQEAEDTEGDVVLGPFM